MTDRILAVYAHPDDCEISAGATLAKWAADGREVHILVVSDGEKGSQDPGRDRRELVALRKVESMNASRVLGAAEVRFLDVVDGEVENTKALRERVVRIIRELHPAIVVTHDPTAWFFGNRYYNHRDHRATGELVLDAVSPAAGNPHFFPELLVEGLHPWDVPEVWLSPTLEAGHTEDVTGYVETKLAALAEHASQLADEQLGFFKEWIPAMAVEEGKKIGVEHAEGFRILNFAG